MTQKEYVNLVSKFNKKLYMNIRYKLDFDSLDQWWCHTSFKSRHVRVFKGDSIIGSYTFEQNILDKHKLLVYKFNKKICMFYYEIDQ